ncbi:hypothetical protein [Argonema antarcticum]|uniref:hypothetical protein n=1 Tax=Argonema antarcticum TaxID=2942763 RepID=UPI002011BC67|nr:hypothetical protein [Argonema antarcticum]MCL1472192.1 hypothetical protein [Argonema antarcticum A004/B2]
MPTARYANALPKNSDRTTKHKERSLDYATIGWIAIALPKNSDRCYGYFGIVV